MKGMIIMNRKMRRITAAAFAVLALSAPVPAAMNGAACSIGISVSADEQHEWEEPTYTWAADCSTVTAERVCKDDPSLTEKETVKTSSKVTKKKGDMTVGDVEYTSDAFKNPAFEVQTKTLTNIPKETYTIYNIPPKDPESKEMSPVVTFIPVSSVQTDDSTDVNSKLIRVAYDDKCPVIYKASFSSGILHLNWQEVRGATNYRVYRISGDKKELIWSTKKTNLWLILPRAADYKYAVSVLVNGKWSEITDSDCVSPETE